MPNYIPYLFLTIISILILIYVIVHKRQFGLTVLFLSFSGMVYTAEFFVLILGNSYVYYPEVFHVPYYDNVLGGNRLQSICYSCFRISSRCLSATLTLADIFCSCVSRCRMVVWVAEYLSFKLVEKRVYIHCRYFFLFIIKVLDACS